jgi:hypothetical protein
MAINERSTMTLEPRERSSDHPGAPRWLAVTSGYMHRVSEADRAAAEYMGTLLDGDAAVRAHASDP